MIEQTTQGNILIVEDDVNLRTILKMQLEKAHYAVRVAEDGSKALLMIDEETPDLVLLDVVMPGLNGYEVCHRIKTNAATANVPIIMLTSMSEQEDKVRGLAAGANDYLTKPYAADELLVRVKNILQWSQLQRAANPLTGLPGNIAIENELNRRMQTGEHFAFVYFDIDGFKAYNDYYDFKKGDEAIKLTASIILSAVSLEGSGEDFVGHVGGDDFILIVRLDCAGAVVQEVIREFDEKAPKIYRKEDRERGYIETQDRAGKLVKFPIMSLTAAVVTNRDKTLDHVGEISQAASELKKFGKQEPGSVVVWERRAA